MRPFIQTKPGATFFQGDPITTVIRKDYGEYILKLDASGFYIVVNVFVSGKDELCLFLNWKDFFQLLTENKEIDKLLLMLKKPCPKLLDLVTSHPKYRMITLPHTGETGIVLMLPLGEYTSLPELMGRTHFIDAAYELGSYGLDIYFEIREKVPFPGWKTRLQEAFVK